MMTTYMAYSTNGPMMTASELTYTWKTMQTYPRYSFDFSYLEEHLDFSTIFQVYEYLPVINSGQYV